MKKGLVGLSLACILASSAFAETSDFFVGVGVGGGGASEKYKASGDGWSESEKVNGGGVSYGVILGYKQFFTEDFGLRYYANVDMSHFTFKDEGYKMKVNLVNYGVNVDAMYNFISNDTLDFGGFLGLGLGGNTWGGSGVKAICDGADCSKTGFDFALNIGLRTVIAQYHGIELAARVPFIATTLVKGSSEGWSYKEKLSHGYDIKVRYVFNF